MLQPPCRAPPCTTERKLAQTLAAFAHPCQAWRIALRMHEPPLAAFFLPREALRSLLQSTARAGAASCAAIFCRILRPRPSCNALHCPARASAASRSLLSPSAALRGMLQPPRLAPPCTTERKLAQPRAAFVHPCKAFRTALRVLAPSCSFSPPRGKTEPAQGSTRQQQPALICQNSGRCRFKILLETSDLVQIL